MSDKPVIDMELLAAPWRREMGRAEAQFVRRVALMSTSAEELELLLTQAGFEVEWTDKANGEFKYRRVAR